MDVFYMNDGHTALHVAVFQGRHDEMKRLLKDGADVDAEDDLEYRPIHYAAALGDFQAAEILVRNKARLGATTTVFSPLYYAIKARSARVVELLIQRGCDVNETVKGNNGLLHEAVVINDVEIARLLLEKGCRASRANALSLTPLGLALRCRQHGMMKLLLAYGASPGEEVEAETTALSKAVSLGDEEALSLLLAVSTASELGQRDRRRNGLLHQAIGWSRVGCARLLLEAGLEVDARGRHGATALQLAVRQSDYPGTRLLLEAGAEPNLRDARGQTALQLALRHGAEERLIDLLFEHWADTETPGIRGERALPLALRCRASRAVVQKLICHGASVERLQVCQVYSGLLGTAASIEPLLVSGADYNCQHRFCSASFKHYLARYFVKNKAAGFCTDERAILRARFYELDRFEASCQAELERMRTSRMFDGLSYYDFLVADKQRLIGLARRRELYRIFEQQRLHSVLFPIYEEMLEMNYYRASCYTRVFDAAVSTLPLLIKLDVPKLVAEVILKFLSENDMRNMGVATSNVEVKVNKRWRKSWTNDSFGR